MFCHDSDKNNNNDGNIKATTTKFVKQCMQTYFTIVCLPHNNWFAYELFPMDWPGDLRDTKELLYKKTQNGPKIAFLSKIHKVLIFRRLISGRPLSMAIPSLVDYPTCLFRLIVPHASYFVVVCLIVFSSLFFECKNQNKIRNQRPTDNIHRMTVIFQIFFFSSKQQQIM